MNRQELILVAMASAKDAAYSPVQLQKLLFLIEKNVPNIIEGAGFDFYAHHYGPFSTWLCRDLEGLARENQVDVIQTGTFRSHRLTPGGFEQGDKLLKKIAPHIAEYLGRVSSFVLQANFSELVSAIYKAYPEMKVNSVFRG